MERKIKQVIIIRKDLKMRRGKEVAQVCHIDSITSQIPSLGLY